VANFRQNVWESSIGPIRASSTYSSVDVLRRTQYRTPVGSLENIVLCCARFTKLYHSNEEAVLLNIATNTCRLVLLRIGYRCSQHVEGFYGRLSHLKCISERRNRQIVIVSNFIQVLSVLLFV
jgi:hypothetical protein